MKRLYLVRHAKSSWHHPGLGDFDRPLSERGLSDAPRMAKRLQAHHARPTTIVTSDARRALATAEIFANLLAVDRQHFIRDNALYLADVSRLFDVVAAQDDDCAALMIVAHNPGMTEFANRLVPSLTLGNLPTAGVVAVDSDIQSWLELDGCRSTLAFYDYPKAERSDA